MVACLVQCRDEILLGPPSFLSWFLPVYLMVRIYFCATSLLDISGRQWVGDNFWGERLPASCPRNKPSLFGFIRAFLMDWASGNPRWERSFSLRFCTPSPEEGESREKGKKREEGSESLQGALVVLLNEVGWDGNEATNAPAREGKEGTCLFASQANSAKEREFNPKVQRASI